MMTYSPTGKLRKPEAQVVSPSADLPMLRKEPETARDGVDQAIGNFDAVALAGDVKPDVVEFGFRFR